MATGIAAALLVFSGVWLTLEWRMSGPTDDTLRLVPVGIVKVAVGSAMVIYIHVLWLPWAALALSIVSFLALFSRRKEMETPWLVVRSVLLIYLLVVGLLIWTKFF